MNWTDYVIIALLVFSSIAGLMRGLLREIVSLVTWLAAVVLAWQYSGLLEPHLGGALSGDSVRPWAARAIIFIVVLLIGMAIGAIVSRFTRLSIYSAAWITCSASCLDWRAVSWCSDSLRSCATRCAG